ncbi:MAG: hypothetical protein J6S85_19945 [Methanobrevibacter sp.]|nr:hypothetical protein [Methanobrevibacter sp.]
MGLKEKLKDYYGALTSDVERFVDSKTGFTSAQLDDIYNYIVTTFSKSSGGPTVRQLSTVFSNFIPQTDAETKKFVCSVCNVCNSKYDSQMMFCPFCWKKEQKKVMSHSTLVKDTEITGVIAYNKSHFTDQDLNNPVERKAGYKSCYFCQLEFKTKCEHFGNSSYLCHYTDECDCYACCVSVRKRNAEIKMKIEEMKRGA